MPKNWFEQKEVGAGEKRLILAYYFYKIFGAFVLRIIAFFVVLSVYLISKERREASKKFFQVIGKANFFNSFRQFLNYGNALVDKFLAFTGDFNQEQIVFDKVEDYKGAFFITSHIGNVEILRAFLSDKNSLKANVFLQSNACEVFNKFLKKFENVVNIDIFPVEEIGLETSMMISERLKSGELVFMAGDRVSAQNSFKTYSADFLGQKINLPLGALKFALLMEAPIYFIVCVKRGKKYFVYTKKFESKNSKKSEIFDDLKQNYVKFLEEYTLKYPLQYYNFFNVFS